MRLSWIYFKDMQGAADDWAVPRDAEDQTRGIGAVPADFPA